MTQFEMIILQKNDLSRRRLKKKPTFCVEYYLAQDFFGKFNSPTAAEEGTAAAMCL